MKKKWLILGLIVIGIIMTVFFYTRIEQQKKAGITFDEFSEISPYDNTEMKAEAKQKLQQGVTPSNIISDDNTDDHYIGLSFQGLSDSVTNQKIISLLKEYDRKATFFVPAVQAVECREDVAAMFENGNTIASNALNGASHMEDMPEDDLINDFTAANKVIESITGNQAPMLQCKATEYTDELLKVANASGNPKVIYTTHIINYQSFTNYTQIYAYVNRLPRGAILTIKMSGILDEIEIEKQEVDLKPEEDMQPTIDPEELKFQQLPEEDRIVQIVEWILMALEETNYQTKSIDQFTTVMNDQSPVQTVAVDEETLMSDEKEVAVYPYIPSTRNYAGLQIRGIKDQEKLDAFLTKLAEKEQTATFYVTAEEVNSYPDRIQKILDAGCSVENGGETDELLTDHTTEEVRKSITACNRALKNGFDMTPTFFMPAGGRYDQQVQDAVKAENMIMVTYNKRPVTRMDTSLEEIMKTFRRTLSRGSLVYMNLDTFQNIDELSDGVLHMIQDKEYTTLAITDLYAKKGSDEVLTAYQIPVSISSAEIAALKAKGAGEAPARQMVYTTERAVAFSFSGIQNTSATYHVLDSMTAMNAKGTFFATYEEMKKCSGTVREILQRGHEMGNELIATDATTFESACNEIAAARKYLSYNYQMTPDIVMCPIARTKNEKAISEMKKAIQAMNCTLAGSSVSITQSALKGITTAPEYYEALTQSKFHIQLGQIIYTRLDYLDNSDILGDVLVQLKQEKIDPIAYYDTYLNSYMWAYEIKPVGAVLHNTADGGAKLYALNSGAGASNMINENKIQFPDNETFLQTVESRYIGNPDVSDQTGLVDFVKDEITRIDQTGKMPGDTSDQHVFLSFDDWGTDQSLNHLLYVLNKYHIKATFFVRSNNVPGNPNLLREIAMEGHEIGSHTSSHYRLSNEVDTGVEGTYDNDTLSGEEAVALRLDVVKSYQELYKVVGDVNVNGHAALAPIFRPPTLAVSKIGLLQIFETGYQFSISGDFSTGDYQYKKAEGGVTKLTDKLENGYSYWGGTRKIQSHSIVVMHMSENSECTAEAIENWMEDGAGSHFNFGTPIYQYLTK